MPRKCANRIRKSASFTTESWWTDHLSQGGNGGQPTQAQQNAIAFMRDPPRDMSIGWQWDLAGGVAGILKGVAEGGLKGLAKWFSKRSAKEVAAETWGNPKTLADHFKRHGADFGARTADDYAEAAAGFLSRSQRSGLPTKIDEAGLIRQSMGTRRTSTTGTRRRECLHGFREPTGALSCVRL